MNPIDFSDPRFWLDLVQWIAMGVMALLMWLRKPGMDAGKKVDDLRSHMDVRFTNIDLRLSAQEERGKHVPSDEELAELEGQVKALAARFDGMQELMAKIDRQVTMISDYLMHRGGK